MVCTLVTPSRACTFYETAFVKPHPLFFVLVMLRQDGTDYGPGSPEPFYSRPALSLPRASADSLLRIAENMRGQMLGLIASWGQGPGGLAHLVASSCVEAVLNDLLSVLARTGTRYPLLRTPKDVPAKRCPESTHLTLGSPEGTPGAKAVTQTRALCWSTSACGGLTLGWLHPQRHAPAARHFDPPRDRLGPLRERARLQVLP